MQKTQPVTDDLGRSAADDLASIKLHIPVPLSQKAPEDECLKSLLAKARGKVPPEVMDVVFAWNHFGLPEVTHALGTWNKWCMSAKTGEDFDR